MNFAIIGAGKVGTAVGLLLRQKGNEIAGVASRTKESAAGAAYLLKTEVKPVLQLSKEAEVLLITTSDTAIAEVCAEIRCAGGFFKGQTVVHFSGSLTTDVLEPARDSGCHLVSIHPLQSCASVKLAVQNLPGSIFSIQGDEEANTIAEKIVADLGGQFFYIDKETKPLYHAAACAASNYFVTLLDLSRQLMQSAGMPGELGAKALLPLVEGTLKNVEKLGTAAALTGPISRGDMSTLEEHLQVMWQKAPELLHIYSVLGQQTALLAERKGSISKETRQSFERLFNDRQNPDQEFDFQSFKLQNLS